MNSSAKPPTLVSAETDTQIPRLIWMLWWQDIEHAPEVVRVCIRSWQHHNPNWKLVLLNQQNVFDYVNAEDMPDLSREDISIQKMANLIRINLLKQHGGVWADATSFCARPLDDWLNEAAPSGFFAFANPGRDRKLSNWFLASSKQHPLISSFCAAHQEYWQRNRFDRQNTLFGKLASASSSRIVSALPFLGDFWFSDFCTRYVRVYPYFVFHYHFALLLRREADFAQQWAAVPKLSARDAHKVLKFGVYSRLTKEAMRLIDDVCSPVHKLSWKAPKERGDGMTILDYLAATLSTEGIAGDIDSHGDSGDSLA